MLQFVTKWCYVRLFKSTLMVLNWQKRPYLWTDLISWMVARFAPMFKIFQARWRWVNSAVLDRHWLKPVRKLPVVPKFGSFQRFNGIEEPTMNFIREYQSCRDVYPCFRRHTQLDAIHGCILRSNFVWDHLPGKPWNVGYYVVSSESWFFSRSTFQTSVVSQFSGD